ncbi:MAG: glycosyltransferase family 4 protein [Mucilaginibacter sp.]|nr:glycosyltransferase family 4 protein [Mucilaginibacter sp.]
MLYLGLFALFYIIIIYYFKVATKYNIIDKPNERSSHTEITIRGGGIIFMVASLAVFVLHPSYWLLVLGSLLIGIISFIDDRITLSSKIRLLVHVVSVTLMLFFLDVFSLPAYLILALYIICIGIINMYNFMDGINGITGLYTLVVLGGLQYVNHQLNIIEADLIYLPMIASIVFLFFNFRKRARCFAGDVGSVSIAFWIAFLLFKLILLTGDWKYLLFLGVYGVDSVLTILHRLILKENIFQPHRLHFYQILANDRKVPHLLVSVGYAIVQVAVIIFVIANPDLVFYKTFVIVLTPLIIAYLVLKPKLQNKVVMK